MTEMVDLPLKGDALLHHGIQLVFRESPEHGFNMLVMFFLASRIDHDVVVIDNYKVLALGIKISY